jgi:hypothetical protein
MPREPLKEEGLNDGFHNHTVGLTFIKKQLLLVNH